MPQPYEAVAARVGERLGVPPLSQEEAEQVLALARSVARNSDDRRAAPLVCYLVGRAVAEADASERERLLQSAEEAVAGSGD
jgi:tellurite resistance protein